MQVIVKKSIKFGGKRPAIDSTIEMDDKNAADCIARGLVAIPGAESPKAEDAHVSPTKKAREERRAQAAKAESPKAEEVVEVETEIKPEAAVDVSANSEKGSNKKGR
jgi:hypothetical protein